MKHSFELSIQREIPVSADKLFRCWTTPELLKLWFCPKPWCVSSADLDLRSGGRCNVTMQSPEGEEFPNQGVYLEVIPNRKLVFTDAYHEGWAPSSKPFMTGIITFTPISDTRTLYTAVVRHWNEDDMKQHQSMGFETGWGKATDQLSELAITL